LNFLPGGKTGIFTVFTNEGSHRLALLDVESRTWRHLFPGMLGRYLPSGHILYYASGIYKAVAFDPLRGEVLGAAVPVLEGTRGISPTGSAERYLGASEAGMVAVVPGGAVLPRTVMAWVDFEGRVEKLPFASAAISNPRVSPDGTRIAVTRVEDGMFGIWVYDLDRASEERLTRESNDFDPQWTPDGKNIVFTSARRGAYDIFMKPADALGVEELLLARPVDEAANAISPDGNWLALLEFTVEAGIDIALFRLGNDAEPATAVRTAAEDTSPRFSRNSSWLAFESAASGRAEVYVQRVADGTARVRVSTAGGRMPVWSPTKDELYYMSGKRVMAFPYRVDGGEFRAEAPRHLVDLPESYAFWAYDSFEISPDGTRLLIRVDSGQDPPPTEIHVTTNWFEELKRLAPPSP
jgi:serine/threonine-protein kinase